MIRETIAALLIGTAGCGSVVTTQQAKIASSAVDQEGFLVNLKILYDAAIAHPSNDPCWATATYQTPVGDLEVFAFRRLGAFVLDPSMQVPDQTYLMCDFPSGVTALRYGSEGGFLVFDYLTNFTGTLGVYDSLGHSRKFSLSQERVPITPRLEALISHAANLIDPEIASLGPTIP